MDARVMVVLAFLVAQPAPAETPVYRWTDAQGQVHYGDQPGAGAAERLNPPPPPPPPPLPAPPPQPPAIPWMDGWVCQSLRAERAIYDRPDVDPRLRDSRRRPELIRLRKEAQQRAQQRVFDSGCAYEWERPPAKAPPAPVGVQREGVNGLGYGPLLLMAFLAACVVIRVFGPKSGG